MERATDGEGKEGYSKTAGAFGDVPVNDSIEDDNTGYAGGPINQSDQPMDYYPYSPETDTVGEVVHFLVFDTGALYKLYRRYRTRGSRALLEIKDTRLPCNTLETIMDVVLDHGGNEFHVYIRHR